MKKDEVKAKIRFAKLQRKEMTLIHALFVLECERIVPTEELTVSLEEEIREKMVSEICNLLNGNTQEVV